MVEDGGLSLRDRLTRMEATIDRIDVRMDNMVTRDTMIDYDLRLRSLERLADKWVPDAVQADTRRREWDEMRRQYNTLKGVENYRRWFLGAAIATGSAILGLVVEVFRLVH
jgi:hypothetical protein